MEWTSPEGEVASPDTYVKWFVPDTGADSPSAREYEYTRPDAVPVKKVSDLAGAIALIAVCGACIHK